MVIGCKFQPLTLYTSFHDLINVYSRRSRADNPRGQNFDVNRNLLSLRLFAISFKKISLESDFIQFGDEIFMSRGTSCHFIHLLQVSKKCL